MNHEKSFPVAAQNKVLNQTESRNLFRFLSYIRGSLPGAISPLEGVLAMSVDIFGCHNSEGVPGISWVGARDGAEHQTMNRTSPHRRQLPGPKTSAEAEKSWFILK